MKEAYLYEKATDGRVKCILCSHGCTISPGKRGICKVRENRNGVLYTLVYDRLISANNDPIEKKPLFHFLPGSFSYSISTVGCNFQCKHCQNWQISQYPRFNQGKIIGDEINPEAIVNNALMHGARSISYTYVEPTIFYELAKDTGLRAKKSGLRNVFVSNGYMSQETCRDCVSFLHAINIDLKAFTDKFYKEICKARLQPVLDCITSLFKAGIWIEITTLIIPGLNDSREELRDIASFIYQLSPDIPWHVTAFHPTFELMDRPPTPVETLKMAREIGLEQGLRYVYQGNVPGSGGENTYCPQCGTLLLKRLGFQVLENRLDGNRCPECATSIAGIWS